MAGVDCRRRRRPHARPLPVGDSRNRDGQDPEKRRNYVSGLRRRQPPCGNNIGCLAQKCEARVSPLLPDLVELDSPSFISSHYRDPNLQPGERFADGAILIRTLPTQNERISKGASIMLLIPSGGNNVLVSRGGTQTRDPANAQAEGGNLRSGSVAGHSRHKYLTAFVSVH